MKLRLFIYLFVIIIIISFFIIIIFFFLGGGGDFAAETFQQCFRNQSSESLDPPN